VIVISTFITLIPKIESPQCLSDVIGGVISLTQSAFMHGRQILDGLLIANELVDDARKRKKERSAYV